MTALDNGFINGISFVKTQTCGVINKFPFSIPTLTSSQCTSLPILDPLFLSHVSLLFCYFTPSSTYFSLPFYCPPHHSSNLSSFPICFSPCLFVPFIPLLSPLFPFSTSSSSFPLYYSTLLNHYVLRLHCSLFSFYSQMIYRVLLRSSCLTD